MTLEEVVEQFTDERRTATNTVGEKELVVKLLSEHATREINKAADKLYLSLVTDIKQIGFNTSILGIYPNLKEVKNHFIGLSFEADIDANGWTLSPEKTIW